MATNAGEETFHANKLSELDGASSAAVHGETIVGGVLWIERNGIELMTEKTTFDVATIIKATDPTSARS